MEHSYYSILLDSPHGHCATHPAHESQDWIWYRNQPEPPFENNQTKYGTPQLTMTLSEEEFEKFKREIKPIFKDHEVYYHLIELTKKPFANVIYDREPISRWSFGNVTLIGDAAHPVTPNMGQGANMAIEDAFALSILLSRYFQYPEGHQEAFYQLHIQNESQF